jgi:outer membrane protein
MFVETTEDYPDGKPCWVVLSCGQERMVNMLSSLIIRLIGVALILLSAPSFADFVGIYAGVGGWDNSFDGDVVSDVDVDGELGLSGDTANSLYVAFEHPIPIIPNIKVARTTLQDSGTGVISAEFEFEGTPFNISQPVSADLDVDLTDLTLYYEIWDTGFDFDVGVTARNYKGELLIDQVMQDFDEYVPMGYVAGRVGLPFSGLFLGAEANVTTYKGNTASDYSVRLGWETSSFIFPEFGIEAGYREIRLETDEDSLGIALDIGLEGVFVNLVAHF